MTSPYTYGWEYRFPEGRIHIVTGHKKPRCVLIHTKGSNMEISVGHELPIQSSETSHAITTLIMRAGVAMTPRLIFPHAMELSAALGIEDVHWEAGHGRRVLGSCYRSTRRIRLSGALVYAPVEIREYVIWHELAHLTHFNHSPAFHRLCNEYCHGSESELRAAFNAHRWPWTVSRT